DPCQPKLSESYHLLRIPARLKSIVGCRKYLLRIQRRHRVSTHGTSLVSINSFGQYFVRRSTSYWTSSCLE
ncbi:hypothetical protein V3C99_001732, partial [Haemonchus contortus]